MTWKCCQINFREVAKFGGSSLKGFKVIQPFNKGALKASFPTGLNRVNMVFLSYERRPVLN